MKSEILEVDSLRWRTARRSAANGACVEVAPAAGTILIRDSKDREGPVVQYPGDSWRAFLWAAKKGQFDLECV